jgi:hypothetical protein
VQHHAPLLPAVLLLLLLLLRCGCRLLQQTPLDSFDQYLRSYLWLFAS